MYPYQAPPPIPPRRPFYRRHPVLSIVTSLGLLIVAGAAVAASVGGSGHVNDTPAPSSSASQAAVPSSQAVTVPAQSTPAFQPATLLSQGGHGTEATRAFTSDSGNYVVSWTYSGNSDSFGPSNFIMTEDGGNDYNSSSLPNDIAASGQGSTEVTSDPGAHKFNVQSEGDWTVKVVSEP